MTEYCTVIGPVLCSEAQQTAVTRTLPSLAEGCGYTIVLVVELSIMPLVNVYPDRQPRCQNIRLTLPNISFQMHIHVILFVWSKRVVDISGQVDADVGDLQDGLINVYQPVYQACLCL